MGRGRADLRLAQAVPWQRSDVSSVSDQLELFAQYMQEGLLTASVAIGLDVMAEFMESRRHRGRRPEGTHNLPVPQSAMATSRPPSPWAGGGWR